ncbi:MAG: histidine phosphatase family protein [Deltaproteobacteria bacterium]|nr:histidine phosphatase family protein [Deltaproteobacteria bacterium]
MTNQDNTRMVFVRHGQTEWNVEGRAQGHADSILTSLGRAQAAAVGKRLKELEFTRLYSSDLGRTQQTAGIIAGYTGHGIITDPRLREKNMGVFEGLTRPEIEENYSEELARYFKLDPDHVVTNGESDRQFFTRSTACFEELASSHSGETIVVVTHGGVLKNLFYYVIDLPLEAPRRHSILNSSLNTVLRENGNWRLETWGDVTHLWERGQVCS